MVGKAEQTVQELIKKFNEKRERELHEAVLQKLCSPRGRILPGEPVLKSGFVFYFVPPSRSDNSLQNAYKQIL